jgi:streptogramin lyase
MDVSLRRQLVAALAASLAASLTACGGAADQTSLSGNKVVDSSNSPQTTPPTPPPPPPPPPPAPPPPAGPGDPIVTSYSAAASGVAPALEGGSIAQGGDGALWFSGGFVPNQIGRMTSAGAVSYPVTKAPGLVSFNPGPLARGPDGNIWFADPLAGIDIAGTIGTVDIATKVASEFSTPLMKTTIQISARTSQDQSCDTATAVCIPVPTGTCVPAPARAGVPGIPASGAIPAVPPVPPYLGSTCRTVTTGPTLVPACMPIAPILANGYTTTTCPTTTVGPTSVVTCSLEDPVAGNAFIRIVCTGITPGSQAYKITTGPDGNLWFTEYNGLHVGKFDVVSKLATEYGPLQGPASSIAAGPDGNLWFSERSGDGSSSVLGRITTAGAITEYKTTPVPGSVVALTAGGDGHVWFVKDGFGGPAVGRVDPATGAVTLFMSGLNGAFTLFGGIALGGDGNVWFTSYYDGLIGRVTPAGAITEFTGVAPNAQLNAITAGPQIAGAYTLWVTDPTNKSVAKLTLR